MRHDDTCRLVLDGYAVDVSGFRHGSATIEEDLSKRDFTINALGADFNAVFSSEKQIEIVDPMNGIDDLEKMVIRSCPGAFSDDPLRMVRAFRFAALLGFEIEPGTLTEIAAKANLIDLSASERVSYELDEIMRSSRAYEAFSKMYEVGLTAWVTPELHEGHGVLQPSSHHLDVLQHNLQTLEQVERIISRPVDFFPQDGEEIAAYLKDERAVASVKWAALFHDVGKPRTKEIVAEESDRITFYGHDEAGAQLFESFARRLRWSKANRELVIQLIAMHMHPFHLCNVIRSKGSISERAKLKLCRKGGDHLTGLFLVAMADSFAGQGTGRVDTIEAEIAALFNELNRLNKERVIPVLTGPKLLTGHDLINIFDISPSPLFKEILSALDIAIIEGTVRSKDDAIRWVEAFLAKQEVS